MAQDRSGSDSNFQRGRAAETRAARFLETQGVQIIGRNVRTGQGEIDLIGSARGLILFIEVKARALDHFGGAAASITMRKQQRLIRAAHSWLADHSHHQCRHSGRAQGGTALPRCRFDAILIDRLGLRWVRDAFRA